jgi:hypothetical protein
MTQCNEQLLVIGTLVTLNAVLTMFNCHLLAFLSGGLLARVHVYLTHAEECFLAAPRHAALMATKHLWSCPVGVLTSLVTTHVCRWSMMTTRCGGRRVGTTMYNRHMLALFGGILASRVHV